MAVRYEEPKPQRWDFHRWWLTTPTSFGERRQRPPRRRISPDRHNCAIPSHSAFQKSSQPRSLRDALPIFVDAHQSAGADAAVTTARSDRRVKRDDGLFGDRGQEVPWPSGTKSRNPNDGIFIDGG